MGVYFDIRKQSIQVLCLVPSNPATSLSVPTAVFRALLDGGSGDSTTKKGNLECICNELYRVLANGLVEV